LSRSPASSFTFFCTIYSNAFAKGCTAAGTSINLKSSVERMQRSVDVQGCTKPDGWITKQ